MPSLAQLDVVGVAAGVGAGTAAAQQVPVAIELDLDLGEPPAVALAAVPARLVLPELVLLGDERLDVRVNVFGHGSSTSFRLAAESPRVAARRLPERMKQ